MKTSLAPTFIDVVLPGSFIHFRKICPRWKDFIHSVYCPLSNREKEAVFIFSNQPLHIGKPGNYQPITKNLNISEEEVRNVLYYATEKLNYVERDYKQWLRFKSLAYSVTKKKIKQWDFYFLMPLHIFGFSEETYEILRRAGCDCLKDIKLFKKRELLSLEGFGEKEQEEVNKVFDEVELLKKKGS